MESSEEYGDWDPAEIKQLKRDRNGTVLLGKIKKIHQMKMENDEEERKLQADQAEFDALPKLPPDFQAAKAQLELDVAELQEKDGQMTTELDELGTQFSKLLKKKIQAEENLNKLKEMRQWDLAGAKTLESRFYDKYVAKSKNPKCLELVALMKRHAELAAKEAAIYANGSVVSKEDEAVMLEELAQLDKENDKVLQELKHTEAQIDQTRKSKNDLAIKLQIAQNKKAAEKILLRKELQLAQQKLNQLKVKLAK